MIAGTPHRLRRDADDPRIETLVDRLVHLSRRYGGEDGIAADEIGDPALMQLIAETSSSESATWSRVAALVQERMKG